MNKRNLEWHINIQFCMEIGKSKMLALLKVTSDEHSEENDCFVWHKQFKKGQKDMHNDT